MIYGERAKQTMLYLDKNQKFMGSKTMKKTLLFSFCALILSACASSPSVDDSTGEAVISGVSMTCKKPYVLPQDCSIWSGAKRTITVDGFEINVAASESGDIILVMDAHIFKNSTKTGLSLFMAKDFQSEASNNSFEALKNVLLANGNKILKVRPVKTLSTINGYVLELDSDGYTKIREYTTK